MLQYGNRNEVRAVIQAIMTECIGGQEGHEDITTCFLFINHGVMATA
jgi:hypothetical protein